MGEFLLPGAVATNAGRGSAQFNFDAQDIGNMCALSRQRTSPGAVDRKRKLGAQASRRIVNRLRSAPTATPCPLRRSSRNSAFSRHDISGWGKALWVLALVLTSYLGIFAYLITQGRGTAFSNCRPDVTHRLDFAKP